MTRLAVKRTYTPEEYLTAERTALTKSEYVNGQIYEMAGASREHNFIAGDVFGELRSQLRGRRCELYMSDMRVRVSPTGLYTYPDVVVVCGRPRFEDAHVDVLLNPTVIFEVLSSSTEAYDRGEKFAHYRYLESLQEYVLIAQERMRVEHFARMGSQWLLTAYSNPDEILALPSIECAVPLSEIYARVELSTEDVLARE
ncbi:MAG: Uma2 family endonuclease [Chloroflexi bacterium]|nr:Uma2 family endonuclease [Chloroflexota bacterium]